MTSLWKTNADGGPLLNDEAPDDERVQLCDEERLPSGAVMRHEAMLINEVSLVLAEKRTSLSVMRTGLAILALPISVLSVLIVISRYYDPMQVMYLLAPLLGLCVILTGLGSYLIIKALRRITHLNRLVASLKKQKTSLRKLGLAMNDLVAPDTDF